MSSQTIKTSCSQDEHCPLCFSHSQWPLKQASATPNVRSAIYRNNLFSRNKESACRSAQICRVLPGSSRLPGQTLAITNRQLFLDELFQWFQARISQLGLIICTVILFIYVLLLYSEMIWCIRQCSVNVHVNFKQGATSVYVGGRRNIYIYINAFFGSLWHIGQSCITWCHHVCINT